MRPWSLVLAAALSSAGCTATAPGSCPDGVVRGFAVSPARDTGGAATPVLAAEQQSGRTGWRVVREDSRGTTLVAGTSSRHVLRGADGTWQVDGGQDC